MTDDEAEGSAFRVYYPTFVVSAEIEGAACITAPTGERWLPVFTDTDLAGRFIEDGNLTGYTVRQLETRKELQDVVRPAMKEGASHVIIDPEPTGRLKAVGFPIEKFLRAIEG